MRPVNAQPRSAQMNNNGVHTACGRMLKKLREYDFAIVETVLFLDTHPNNRKALAYYAKLKAERAALASEYEKNVGPITMYGNENVNKWDWIDGPWPWEGEK